MATNPIVSIIQLMTDEELRSAYNDNIEYQRTGILGEDSVTRKIRENIVDALHIHVDWDPGCRFLLDYMMQEAARRYFDHLDLDIARWHEGQTDLIE